MKGLSSDVEPPDVIMISILYLPKSITAIYSTNIFYYNIFKCSISLHKAFGCAMSLKTCHLCGESYYKGLWQAEWRASKCICFNKNSVSNCIQSIHLSPNKKAHLSGVSRLYEGYTTASSPFPAAHSVDLASFRLEALPHCAGGLDTFHEKCDVEQLDLKRLLHALSNVPNVHITTHISNYDYCIVIPTSSRKFGADESCNQGSRTHLRTENQKFTDKLKHDLTQPGKQDLSLEQHKRYFQASSPRTSRTNIGLSINGGFHVSTSGFKGCISGVPRPRVLENQILQ